MLQSAHRYKIKKEKLLGKGPLLPSIQETEKETHARFD